MNDYVKNPEYLEKQFALVTNLIPEKDFEVCYASDSSLKMVSKILKDYRMSASMRKLIETELDFIKNYKDQPYIIDYKNFRIIMMDPDCEKIPSWKKVYKLQIDRYGGLLLNECGVRMIPLYVYHANSVVIGEKCAEIPFNPDTEIYHRKTIFVDNCEWYIKVECLINASDFFIEGAMYDYVKKYIVEAHRDAVFIKGLDGKYHFVLGSETKETKPQNDQKKKIESKSESSRISKIEYGLQLAETAAKRGTCLRRRFGAVIIKDDIVVSTGYVGAPRGRINCCDRGVCLRNEKGIKPGERYELCRSVHAEMNAIINASREEMKDATLYLVGLENNGSYTEAAPCAMCKRVIINAGIKQVVARTPNVINIFDVHDWVTNDDSLDIHEGY